MHVLPPTQLPPAPLVVELVEDVAPPVPLAVEVVEDVLAALFTEVVVEDVPLPPEPPGVRTLRAPGVRLLRTVRSLRNGDVILAKQGEQVPA